MPGEGNIGDIVHYVNGRFDYHQRVYKISSFPDNVMGRYVYHVLKATFKKWALGQTVKATVDSLRLPTFENFLIPLPSFQEQQNIASALDLLDTQIISIQHLLSKYESIKKATVKKLMTPEEGWKLISFGELCDDYGYGVSAAAKEYDGANKYIRITDIDDTSHKFLPAPLASPSFFSEKHIVHDGDILFARTGASVGKSYLYNPNDGRLIYAGFLIRMHIDPSKANPAFIFQQTLTNVYWQWVATESARTGQPGLNLEQYKKWKVLIPSIEVQNAIVYKLSAYDNKISELNKTLSKLIKVKLSMLQYFFGD